MHAVIIVFGAMVAVSLLRLASAIGCVLVSPRTTSGRGDRN